MRDRLSQLESAMKEAQAREAKDAKPAEPPPPGLTPPPPPPPPAPRPSHHPMTASVRPEPHPVFQFKQGGRTLTATVSKASLLGLSPEDIPGGSGSAGGAAGGAAQAPGPPAATGASFIAPATQSAQTAPVAAAPAVRAAAPAPAPAAPPPAPTVHVVLQTYGSHGAGPASVQSVHSYAGPNGSRPSSPPAGGGGSGSDGWRWTRSPRSTRDAGDEADEGGEAAAGRGAREPRRRGGAEGTAAAAAEPQRLGRKTTSLTALEVDDKGQREPLPLPLTPAGPRGQEGAGAALGGGGSSRELPPASRFQFGPPARREPAPSAAPLGAAVSQPQGPQPQQAAADGTAAGLPPQPPARWQPQPQPLLQGPAGFAPPAGRPYSPHPGYGAGVFGEGPWQPTTAHTRAHTTAHEGPHEGPWQPTTRYEAAGSFSSWRGEPHAAGLQPGRPHAGSGPPVMMEASRAAPVGAGHGPGSGAAHGPSAGWGLPPDRKGFGGAAAANALALLPLPQLPAAQPEQGGESGLEEGHGALSGLERALQALEAQSRSAMASPPKRRAQRQPLPPSAAGLQPHSWLGTSPREPGEGSTGRAGGRQLSGDASGADADAGGEPLAVLDALRARASVLGSSGDVAPRSRLDGRRGLGGTGEEEEAEAELREARGGEDAEAEAALQRLEAASVQAQVSPRMLQRAHGFAAAGKTQCWPAARRIA
jgi:hypothetical protein